MIERTYPAISNYGRAEPDSIHRFEFGKENPGYRDGLEEVVESS
ncbi:hypothetical protein LEP1GSC047_4013 [Leptospira inadai serovar Lyme str. 10]|uniref:Uncharacterized protein n=1 Tax=Leptospira inadai serovar Lyme str. 10 TaxID=1049790 RepID=V6HK48_9LEPT|nr:hypothetical protein [Leptospira inadai]EQA37260.1 hypothetical protein LEP1GSC047_4013 [Leptospira inadai serovar Lyme str. 10]